VTDVAGYFARQPVTNGKRSPSQGAFGCLIGRAKVFFGAAGLCAVVLIWWAGIAGFAAPDGLAARFSPQAAFASLMHLLKSSDLPLHVAVSLKRILIGLAFALAIGVPVGLAVGLNRTLEAATSPAFQFLRMISPLSWMPIAVMALGVGDYPIYFLLAFAAVWPILLSTAAGVRQLDPAWLLLSRSLSATSWETLVHVVIPGVLAHVLTGVRLAIGILWIVLVPCEMLGVSAGLGYFILDTRDRLAYSELMAMVLLIGFLGFLLDAAARALHRFWLRQPTA
jgi:NitT/TauT family transport system permease protein